MYEGIYGLSCVENHVQAVLRQHGERVEASYYNSAVPLADLYKQMVTEGIRQEHFYLLERVQEIWKRLGILELVKIKHAPAAKMLQAVCSCQKNECLLVRVTPDFTRRKLLARGLREDHFVCVKKGGNKFEVYNDIPERRLWLREEQLEESYDGEYFHLSIRRKMTKADRDYLWQNRRFRPEEFYMQKFMAVGFEDLEQIGYKLRNLTGVYKLLRYRMAEYYGQYVDTEFIRQVMPEIEKFYAMFEYYNLKSVSKTDKYKELFDQLVNLDDKIMSTLKKKMEEKGC
ncbi:MAG: hypothetical protein HFI75_04755 [Lachnospiraceae bacterium]|nr:hypothetical protein [Lachnospiraceae bacterium]